MKTQLKYAAGLLIALFCGAGAYAQTLQEAIRLTDNEQYDKAYAMFSQLVKSDPTNGDNYFYFGDLLLKEENPDSAKVLFQKGVDINATNPLVHVGLARYYMYTGQTAEGQKEIAYAKSLLTTQAGKKGTGLPKPRQAQIYLEIAETYIWAKEPDPDAAIELTKLAEGLDPKNPEVFIARGDAMLKKDPVNASPAIGNYQTAAKMDAKSCKAIIRIGSVYAAGKNMKSAISYYNQAIAIDPNFAPAYRLRGEAQYQVAKFDSASISYEKYLSLNDDCHSRYRYCAFLYKSGDYDNAITQGQKVLSCDSSITVVYRILGLSYLSKKPADAANAITYFNLFFAKQKIYGKPQITSNDYVKRGAAYSENGEDSLAVLDYEKAIKLDSTNGDLYFELAGKYWKLKQFDMAAATYKRKIDADPAKANISDWNAYGLALMKQKEYAKADSAFMKVVELDPQNPVGWIGRARANASLDPDGKKALARPYYETYFDLASGDKEKNKRDLTTAGIYLASIHYVNKEYACAKTYYQFVKDLDPTNEAATTALEQDKSIKAATAADMGTCKLPESGSK